MHIDRKLKTTIAPGVSYQLWTPAALPFLTQQASFSVEPAKSATPTQQRLIKDMERNLRAFQRISQVPVPTGRINHSRVRCCVAMTERIKRIDRALAALSKNGVMLWWHSSRTRVHFRFFASQ